MATFVVESDSMAQTPRPAFERFEASLLACPKCRRAVKVRKRLLLILPEGEKYEYVCPECGSTCGAIRFKKTSRNCANSCETVPAQAVTYLCRGVTS
jgi:hypothetical protein